MYTFMRIKCEFINIMISKYIRLDIIRRNTARFHKNLQNKNPSAICWDFGANAYKITIRAPVINARTGRGDRI